jgi:hypothetical protein
VGGRSLAFILILFPRFNVDLGARSLVSGVDCNDPEKSPLLKLLVISFFASSWRVHHHAYLTLHVFVESKIIWLKIYFYYLARMVL